MNRLLHWIAFGLLFFGVKTTCAEAQGLFYDGSVVVDSISADIILDDTAMIQAEYVLVNRGEGEEEIEINHPNPTAILTLDGEKLERPLSLMPYEEVLVVFTDEVLIDSSPFKTFTYHPSLLFNGMRNAEPVKELQVTVTLPEGVEQIVGANTEWSSESINNLGRLTLVSEYYNLYPTMISLSWTTLDVNVSVSKTVEPTRIENLEDVITVVIIVENQGDQIVEGIVLSDDFFPREFEPIEPQDAFILTSSNDSDPHIFWRQEIARLEPGKQVSFTYQVRSLLSDQTFDDIRLKPCQLRIEGILVAVSNQSIVINDVPAVSPSEQPAATTAVPAWPITLIITGSLLGVGFMLAAIFLAIRHRRGRKLSN